eukprot:scaffold795_cov375-Prasinococcus_capsulatus_cf.AAC.14
MPVPPLSCCVAARAICECWAGRRSAGRGPRRRLRSARADKLAAGAQRARRIDGRRSPSCHEDDATRRPCACAAPGAAASLHRRGGRGSCGVTAPP